MADESSKPPTQAERLSALEEWADETQQWIESRDAVTDTSVSDQLAEFDSALRVLLDDKYGKNVRPPHLFHHSTRIADPDDLDTVNARRAAESGEPPVESSSDRLAALEEKLEAALKALAEKG